MKNSGWKVYYVDKHLMKWTHGGDGTIELRYPTSERPMYRVIINDRGYVKAFGKPSLIYAKKFAQSYMEQNP